MNARDFARCLQRNFYEFWWETNAVALWLQESLQAFPGIYERVCKVSDKIIQEDFPAESVPSGAQHLRWSVQKMPDFASIFPQLINEFALIRATSLFEVFLTETLRAIFLYIPHLSVKGCNKNGGTLDDKLRALRNFDNKLIFFEDQLGIRFKDSEFTMECLQEVHQIRHVLVHRNGVVDTKFTREVPWTNYHEGDRINLSNDYMYKALHSINMAGTYLHQKLADKYKLSAENDTPERDRL